MSVEIEAPRKPSAFPRPSSLYVPDIPRSVPILDTTSFSPYPTFPGGRNRDPYGLNAYLLHPDDSLWHYVDPMPDPQAATGPTDPIRSASLEGEERSALPRAKLIRKQRSLSLIKKPSPLSQPPVSSGEEDELEDKSVTLQRRRSNSLPANSILAVDLDEPVMSALNDEIVITPKTPKSGKKSLRRVFTKARKSVFGATELPSDVPPIPPLPESSALLAPGMSASSSVSTDPSTPMTSRSNSNFSTISSASSTSSSEGVKTPAEGVSLDVAITGSKLANALQEAGEGKNKGKKWRGWLGGKKIGKTAAPVDSDGSGSNTPLSDLSAETTPNSSTPDLLSSIPKVTLTPSPAIVTPPRGSTPILPPSEQLARQHTWASEQLRRVSMRKMGQLRAPSPHPLALSLRRQNSKLPDEVAFSIRSDQRVFPMSVNSHKGLEGDLAPAQGGLWLNLAIQGVMVKLDRGEQPVGILKTRKNSKKSIVPRPKGALDFINRPPYEERNMVFYPDNTFSPISMARPGYGVWDLDFSPYILGLSEIYEPSTLSWPVLPRTSTENPNLPTEFLDVMKALDDESETKSDASVEVLHTLEDSQHQDDSAALKQLTANAPKPTLASAITTPASSPKKERPLSSFQPKGRHSNKGDTDSSGSEEEESDEDEEEDDEPLAVVAKRRSQSFQSQPRPAPAATSTLDVRPTSTHIRSLSQPAPADKRASKRLSMSMEADMKYREVRAQEALNQVAKARELRAQNAAGHMERLADQERIKEKEAKRRSSMMDLRDHPSTSASANKHKRNSSASIGNYLSPNITPQKLQAQDRHRYHQHDDQNRRRVQSHSHSFTHAQSQSQPHANSRPQNTRAKSSGHVHTSAARKRFSSFYEQDSDSTSSFASDPRSHAHAHAHAQYPHPQHFVHQHHQMVLPPQHMNRGSMYGNGNGNGMMYLPQQMQMQMGMGLYGQSQARGLNTPQNGMGSGRPRMT
ncbi:uncharacterized protein I303_105740 [Kwoniella dejecticola CBS 10117]|uniref:Uncharacterized protein n=1 Tax=Kwoniella dejecticola CBS 10117 TaxID=1296121 RepID=A0A1A6A096_9TREE|nr:uncharacterized protein I303_05762 [Kwoniella dejecticola CBS 10117]OBR83483.1 hypothetical protein I303_05762 [Kwoniella dejecticola CBS 10117]